MKKQALLITLILIAVLAAAVVVVAAPMVAPTTITPPDVGTAGDFDKWYEVSRSGAASVINGDMPDALGGIGSLDQSLPATGTPSPKTDFEYLNAAAGGFGKVNQATQLAFDWYRDLSSTAPAHLTPALRFYIYDPDWVDGPSTFLVVWEGVYNGYPVTAPTNTWITQDVTTGSFWRIPQDINGVPKTISDCSGGTNVALWDTCYVYTPLANWGFSSNAVIAGVNVGLGSGWTGSYQGYVDNITIGTFSGTTIYNFDPVTDPQVVSDPDDTLMLCGSAADVLFRIEDVSRLYSYQFDVSYNTTAVLAPTTAFVNGWFTPANPFGTKACVSGTCTFSATRSLFTNGKAGVYGSGTVAKMTLTAAPAGGSFPLTISNVVLSDRDGGVIPASVAATALQVTACGQATVTGKIKLQGRTVPGDATGTVTFDELDGDFTDPAPVNFDANGDYSITLQVMPGGTNYSIVAAHDLYIYNKLDTISFSSGAQAAPLTELRAGDATTSTSVPARPQYIQVFDLQCIVDNYGPSGQQCSFQPATSNSDINGDGVTNGTDLALAGGNFDRFSFRNWFTPDIP